MNDWPVPLKIVVPQETITVTMAADPPECMLAIHAPSAIRYSWPSSLVSKFGTLVHKTIESFAGSDRKTIDGIIQSETAVEDLLRDQCKQRGIDPNTLSNHWFDGIRLVIRALKELKKLTVDEASHDSMCSNADDSQSKVQNESSAASQTTEGSMIDPELGVRGKFDLRVITPEYILIDDFKSGIVGSDIEKLEKWKKQVAIYALMSFRATNRRKHKARIIAADGIFELELSSNYFDSLSEELIDKKQRWPKSPFLASEHATVSAGCRSCSVRHVCSKYLSTSPWLKIAEWEGEDQKVWSWDVWGKVVRIGTGGKSIVLMTPDKKRVIINNISDFLESGEFALQDEIGVFGLWQAGNYTESQPVFRPPEKGPYSVPPRCLFKRN